MNLKDAKKGSQLYFYEKLLRKADPPVSTVLYFFMIQDKRFMKLLRISLSIHMPAGASTKIFNMSPPLFYL